MSHPMGVQMRLFRGFVIRILEVASYLGILAFTIVGAASASLLLAFSMPVTVAQLGLRDPAMKSIVAIAGGVGGFVVGALIFGFTLLLIDIRENTRR